MKKIIIPVVIFFIIVIGSIAFAVADSYAKTQYGKDTMFHMMTLSEGEILTGEYKDVKTQVTGRNTQKIYSVISVWELKRLYKRPAWDAEEAVYLNFSDGAEYIVAVDPSINDGVFIIYSYKNRTKYFKVNGYNTMSWVKKAISPSGIYSTNEVILN
ncbi:MAG: hypothetical protein KAH14_07980 [Clostridiales bacterium]|nr:hypothetical protein [Clostridiales bacterium]